MSNPFFGRIGDVWKHLLLAQIIEIERPELYYESHAGSAFYPLSPSPDRDFGVYAFLDRAKADPILERSAYHRILRSIGTDRSGAPTRYPGSSALAMMLLGPRAVYRLWDIDGDSVRSIREAAQELGVAEYVVVSSGDGIDGIVSGIRELPVGQAHRTLVFVDPFDPAASSLAHGISSVEAAHIVAARDVPLVYWYAFDDEDERGWAWGALTEPIHREASAWGAEIGPATPDAPGFFEDGMRGCGMVCLNCASAIPTLRALAEAFVDAYRDLQPAHSAIPGLSYSEFRLTGLPT